MLPSILEHEHHLPNHSTRGPNRDWRKYRDDPNKGLAAQLVNYEKFVEYWMEKYDRSQLLLVSYEDMTDGMMGPLAAGRIAHFLGEVEGVNPIKPEAVTCVWETIVNFKNKQQPSDPEQKVLRGKVKVIHPNRVKSLRSGPKDRPYTAQNLADMLALFRRLQSKYSHDEEFVRIMQLYVDVVEKTVPRESSQQQQKRKTRKKQLIGPFFYLWPQIRDLVSSVAKVLTKERGTFLIFLVVLVKKILS